MDGLSRAWSSARFAFDFAVVRRDRPFVLGLAVTDRCNLRCRHCRVWSAHAPHMPLAQIAATLRRFHDRGARLLYLEGGEPFLWRDGELRLADVVGLARRLGYLRVHIYSNGTLPLDAPADFVWVSADGLHETNFALRGSNLDQVLDHARDCATKKAMLFTVNSVNHQDILPFLELVREALPGVPVMFNLHTPYYGQDELLLDEHTSALDPKTAVEVMRLTEEIIAGDSLTAIVVTHNMDQAIRFGHRLIMMNQGRIILDVSGREKEELTVAQVMDHFSRVRGEVYADDAMLLT